MRICVGLRERGAKKADGDTEKCAMNMNIKMNKK